jgi:malonyl-CoA/methylmalonyl-CoA synthetase
MVSGSAALPTQVLNQWKKISGHVLLERYGMTEIGMALTNPYDQDHRKPGHVGNPFPTVNVRIVKAGTDDQVLVEGDSESTRMHRDIEKQGDEAEDIAGDLQVKSPSVFRCYYNKPEATKKEFTKDGWFKTGDTAQFEPTNLQNGSFKILGRTSVDIIKSGGYKIGALDIERVLLEHSNIKDVAICGVEDLKYGQKVAAVIVLDDKNTNLELNDLRDWAKNKMPHYSMPTIMKIMDELPRNAMGKVNKKELVKIAFST